MNWLIEGVIICFVFYESVIISIYKILQKSNPELNTWLILISKGVKLILTAAGILLVKTFTETPIKKFALITAGIYLVSVGVETIFFLKKKQNDSKN